jgi:hypothetical protein
MMTYSKITSGTLLFLVSVLLNGLAEAKPRSQEKLKTLTGYRADSAMKGAGVFFFRHFKNKKPTSYSTLSATDKLHAQFFDTVTRAPYKRIEMKVSPTCQRGKAVSYDKIAKISFDPTNGRGRIKVVNYDGDKANATTFYSSLRGQGMSSASRSNQPHRQAYEVITVKPSVKVQLALPKKGMSRIIKQLATSWKLRALPSQLRSLVREGEQIQIYTHRMRSYEQLQPTLDRELRPAPTTSRRTIHHSYAPVKSMLNHVTYLSPADLKVLLDVVPSSAE